MGSGDKQRASDLRLFINETKAHKGRLTFGSIITIYEERNIFGQLTEICGYEFNSNPISTLRSMVTIRNEAAHETWKQNKSEAKIVRTRYFSLLKETDRLPKDWEDKQVQARAEEVANADASPIQSLAADWRNKWEKLITEWLAESDNLSDKLLVGSLMDFLMLVNGLASDSRVGQEYRSKLLLAINYVILTADLIPDQEGKLHTLRDDVAILTFTLQWLIREVDEADTLAEVMRNHWVRESDPVETINYMGQYIRISHHTLFYENEWAAITPVSEFGPEALWNSSLVDSAPPPENLSNVYELIHEYDDAKEWERDWRSRINEWVSKHSNTAVADVVMLAPDLLVFSIRLLRDSRIGAQAKVRLLATVTYVLNPLDMIPEALVGVVGLTDDMGALALVGLWLTETLKVDESVLRENWPREGDPVEVLRNLHRRLSQVQTIFGEKSGVWNQLCQRFYDDASESPSFVDRVRRLLRRSTA